MTDLVFLWKTIRVVFRAKQPRLFIYSAQKGIFFSGKKSVDILELWFENKLLQLVHNSVGQIIPISLNMSTAEYFLLKKLSDEEKQINL